MLRRGEEKIPLAVYKLKTYLAVFWLTFQPKNGWFSWLLFYHCMFIRHPLKLECLSQHGGKFRELCILKHRAIQSPHLECYIKCLSSLFPRSRWTQAGTGYTSDDIMFLFPLLLFLLLFAHQNSSCFHPQHRQPVLPSFPIAGPVSVRKHQRVTLSNLLLQPGLNAVSEQADGHLFLNKVWKSTAAETDSSQMLYSSPAGTFLSLGLVEFSLTETCACSLLSSHCNMVQTLSPL